MTHRPTWRIVSFCILALLTLAWPALAQTPTPPPTPREALIEAIQARAQRDVELAKPVEGVAALEVLFGAEAANVGLSMVEVLEVYEEAYTAATPVKPWWEDLRPQAGWIAAIILFVLVIFRDALKDSLSKAVKWLLERIYLRLAGFRPFWGMALERYRRRLVERYERLNIPFRPGRPLEMREVYMPLKVSGAQTTDLIDAYRAVAEHKWLMITGAPGAGKTMLLRRLALYYAEEGLADFPTQPVPVLLELNRLSDSQEPLETHLAQALKANDFPGGERFIAAGLEHGMLLLLFDGLDEVARDARPRIVRQIKDLLQAHPKVRAIITCRTNVYNGEFDALVEQRLEIADFSDQQIQRFLASWQAQMPPDKSPKHLLRNLRERPHIMGLVRNPLLLTMIAFLYTDTSFDLPKSGVEFYKMATEFLLGKWDKPKLQPTKYSPIQKQAVLQHLALYNQTRAGKQGQLIMDARAVRQEVRQVLPKVEPPLEGDDETTTQVLAEIVERSGLLLILEGGLSYQFAHLTLQEFFTAQKLQDDTIGLMERFRADPDAWRETLKLWCGLPHDSTTLIRALYAEHPILAFEFLGDAQQVDEELAQEIISAFQARLGEDGATGEAVTRAFATVATNPQVRGQQVFEFLAATVKDAAAAPARRQAAAQALAWSNLLQAAEVLAECALDYPNARPLLAQMGDLATPALTKWAEQGHEWAFDAFQMVGTPDAARAMTDLLWTEDEPQPYWAAWRLAVLLARTDIEDVLRTYPLAKSQQSTEYLKWVWEPFEPYPDSPLSIIAGRIAHLLRTTPSTALSSGSSEIDKRLVIPIFMTSSAAETIKHESEKDETLIEDLQDLSRQWQDQQILGGEHPPSTARLVDMITDQQEHFVARVFDRINPDASLRRMVESLKPAEQFELLRCLIEERTPTIDDWRNKDKRVEYEFDKSWHERGITVCLLLLTALSLWEVATIILNTPQFTIQRSGLHILLGLALLVQGWGGIRERLSVNTMPIFEFAFLFGFSIYVGVVLNPIVGPLIGAVTGGVLCLLLGIASGIDHTVAFAVAPAVIISIMLNDPQIVTGFASFLIANTNPQAIPLAIGLTDFLLDIPGSMVIVAAIVMISQKITTSLTSSQKRGIRSGNLVEYSLLGPYSSAIYIFFALPTRVLERWWGWAGVAFFWPIWALCAGVLWWIGSRQEHLARNPFKRLTEMLNAKASHSQKGKLSSQLKSHLLRSLRKRRGILLP